jgi:hypothetical protein
MSSSQHKLMVTKPCQEAWGSMTHTDNGRHCKSCDKLVIDFSILSDDEISSFFSKNINNPVCGRFHKNQIDRISIYIPTYVLKKPIALWKKFLIIFLVCFGSNLYPFDTILGSNPGLYAQTSSKKQVRKKINYKHKKKKIRLFRELTFILDPQIDIMFMGFTQIIPASATLPILTIPAIKMDPPLKNSDTLSSETSLEKENEEQKKSPNKPHSENSKEYILPARLKYRRKRPRSK